MLKWSVQNRSLDSDNTIKTRQSEDGTKYRSRGGKKWRSLKYVIKFCSLGSRAKIQQNKKMTYIKWKSLKNLIRASNKM